MSDEMAEAWDKAIQAQFKKTEAQYGQEILDRYFAGWKLAGDGTKAVDDELAVEVWHRVFQAVYEMSEEGKLIKA